MEYLRGLRRLREDPDWMPKVGVGALLLLSSMVIPIIGQVALIGWVALVLRCAVAGRETPLPRLEFDLDYLGKLLGTGFKAFLASFIWSLPAGLLIGGSVACLYFGMIFSLISLGQSGDAPPELGLLVLVAFAVAVPVLMMLGILLTLPSQMAMIRAEIADDFNQGLQFREVLDMTKKVFKELLIGSIVLAVVQFALTLISAPLCFLPMWPGMVALMVARAHFGAQLYKLYVERGGTPLPMGPLDPSQPAAVAPVAPPPAAY